MRFQMKRVYLLSAVLLVAMVGCSDEVNPRVATRLNLDASLSGELPSNPLQNKVITSWINKRDGTMSTLFGNDVAVPYARSNAATAYPAGSVLSVVTWGQQEDPRWFGGNIPQKPKAVEFVTVSSPGSYAYQRYEGLPLKKVASVEGNDPKDSDSKGNDSMRRAAYLLAQRAAVMP